jgi:hypothetical protein
MLRQEDHLLGSKPQAFFPLTRENMKTNFPKLMDQFFSADIREYKAFKKLVQHLYTPDAIFEYPTARLSGREEVRSFWTYFLLFRFVNQLFEFKHHHDFQWDPEKLQLNAQMESWGSTNVLRSLLGDISLGKVRRLYLAGV